MQIQRKNIHLITVIWVNVFLQTSICALKKFQRNFYISEGFYLPYYVLHEEVQEDEDYLNTEDCDLFKEGKNQIGSFHVFFETRVHSLETKCSFVIEILSNRRELLTKEKMASFRIHKRILERKLLKEFSIYVATVGSLADKRVEDWSKQEKFSTIVIDEAGQLLNALTVNLTNFGAKRFILAGDPKQLPPSCSSQAAQIAGYDVSLMESVYMCTMMRPRFV